MEKMNVLIVGTGFVGGTLRNYLDKNFYVRVQTFDKAVDKPGKMSRILQENETHIIFVCVPTPPSPQGCDTSIVEQVLEEINENLRRQITLVIKSTIPPRTTYDLAEKYPKLKLFFNPEFLTEANAELDFANSKMQILGYPFDLVCKGDIEQATECFKWCFPNQHIEVVTSTQAEFTKYYINCFLAMKVAFNNEWFDWYTERFDWCTERLGDSRKVKIDAWDEFTDLVNRLDTRIGASHMRVPGPDGKRSFGGKCFPKDVQAALRCFEMPVLREVYDQYKQARGMDSPEDIRGGFDG